MIMSNNNNIICRSYFALLVSTVLCLHNIFRQPNNASSPSMMMITEIQEELDLLRQKQLELDDLRNSRRRKNQILTSTTSTTSTSTTITESNNNNNNTNSSQKKNKTTMTHPLVSVAKSFSHDSNNNINIDKWQHQHQHHQQHQHQQQQQQQQQQQKDDTDDTVDISILKHITLGKNLGSGKYTDTFEAIFDDDENIPTNPILKPTKNKKEYVIKFTTSSSSSNNATTGNNNPRQYYQNVTILSQEIIERLSPHPSIPQTLYFIPSIANPFKSGILKFPFHDASQNIHRRSLARVPNSNMMSIEIVEKVQISKNYNKHNHHIQIPPSKVYCYWRRLFEILHYAHTKNVILRDVQLFNTRINEDGEIVLFDWNRGRIFEPNITTASSCSLKFGHVYPGQNKYFGNHVHEYDVEQLGSRIRDFIDDENSRWDKYNDEKQKRMNVTNNNSKNSSSKITSREDLKLLTDLYKKMKGKKRHRPKPTLRWLLDNHDYFVKYNNNRNNHNESSCILKW